MTQSATFQFYNSLNDFLRPGEKGKWIPYNFMGNPAVKDAIEAIGVPHPEIDVIMANERPVDFKYLLQPADQVKVYPNLPNQHWPTGYSLLRAYQAPYKFVLDVHLGKLARTLRLLGFDTHYENQYDDKTIAQLAATENRIVLTRDVGLLKHKSIQFGYWLRSQHPDEQLKEVMQYYRLVSEITPFTRCMACNGSIVAVPKQTILAEIPAKTKQYFQEFYRCTSCQRVYWQGSHYERMLEFIKSIAKG